ncbi:MAG: AsmA family protein [Legionellales bacterium]|nr:AsmA family protein [Legionellales bacterium]
MGKVIKFILLFILSVVLILVIGGFIAANVIDPNKFKEPLAKQISDRTGRNTTIVGDISWNFFPWLGFSVGDVTMANAEGFGDKPFASIKSLELKVKAMPLLSGNIQVGVLTVVKPEIQLMVNARGRTNWEDLAEVKSTTNNSQTEDTLDEKDETDDFNTEVLNRIQIDQVTLKEGQLVFDNQQTKQEFALSNLNISSQDIAIDREIPFNFHFKFIALEDDITMASGEVDYQGAFRFDSQTWQEQKQALPSIYLDGKLVAKPLTLDKLQITQLTAEIKVEDSLISIAPILANLYQGESVANLDINLKTQTPDIKAAASLKDLQAGALLEDLIGSDQITGIAQAHIKLNTRGTTTPSMLKTLNGSAKFEFTNGVLHGVDVPYLLSWATAVFNSQQPPETEQNKGITPFGSITGSADITNGVVTNNDLSIQAPEYAITGAGQISLVTQMVDYRLAVKSTSKSQSNAINKLEKSLGEPIPILVRGEFANLSAEPDLDIIVKNSARSFIEKQVNRFFPGSLKPKDPAEATEGQGDTDNGEQTGSIEDKAKRILEGLFN